MYHALYRKYRPNKFDDVVGQNIIIKTLKNSIKNNHFSHAYMFFGPRGTGKTTVSKIFARSINCLENNDGDACGKCKNCLNSFEKECVDIIEIDAASNNGVDEIRELKNKISLVPANLKYKVYIIDEVHMLSIGAFNALLKTLEEPPEHAIFILATTDPQKIPETIISRCQCFSFMRISEKMITDRLKYVCGKEKIDIDQEVLNDIAISVDGGMRDALGMLDKLSSFTSEKIVIDDYIDLNGLVSDKDIKIFCENIFFGNISNVLDFLENANSCGKNIIQISIKVMYYLKKQIFEFYLNNKKLSVETDLIVKLINILNEKMFDIKRSGNPVIYIEMILLKFIDDYVIINSNEKKDEKLICDTDYDNISINTKYNQPALNDNIDDSKHDNNNKLITFFENNNNENNILNISEIIDARINNSFAKANKNILKEIQNKMKILNDFTFDQKIGYLVCEILDAKVRVASNDIIVISYEYESKVNQNLININQITDIYNKLTNSNIKFAIISDEKWDVEKNKYITNIKNNIKYEMIDEPKEIVEVKEKDDIIENEAIELFGDIVEFE